MAQTTRKRKGPGKSFRKGLSLAEAIEFFSDPETTEQWFIEQRWPDGIECPECGSKSIQSRPSRKPQPFRCNACRYDFSIKSGTVMHSSKLPLKAWGLALYLNATSLKGVASMKLHRDLGVTQKTAWHLGHRIRKTWEYDTGRFSGPVEVDETYIGGKEANKHAGKKLNAGRGTVGKAVVVGARDRATGKVTTRVVQSTDAPTLQGFVRRHTELGVPCLHGREPVLPGHQPGASDREAQRRGVRGRHDAHQRGREPLGADEAGHRWDIPSPEREAPFPLR